MLPQVAKVLLQERQGIAEKLGGGCHTVGAMMADSSLVVGLEGEGVCFRVCTP